MGTNITGPNARVEGYPLASNTGASTALANHFQGGITSDPEIGLGTGSFLATIVMRVEVSGNFLMNFPFSYHVTGGPAVTWQLNRRFGIFTVNGVAPTPGFFLFPTDAGGSVVTLYQTESMTSTPVAMDLGALDVTGFAPGTLVAYEAFVSAATGTINFSSASAFLPKGQFSVMEVL